MEAADILSVGDGLHRYMTTWVYPENDLDWISATWIIEVCNKLMP